MKSLPNILWWLGLVALVVVAINFFGIFRGISEGQEASIERIGEAIALEPANWEGANVGGQLPIMWYKDLSVGNGILIAVGWYAMLSVILVSIYLLVTLLRTKKKLRLATRAETDEPNKTEQATASQRP